MPSWLLNVDHLSITAGDRQILDDYSCVIHPGEIVALTGKSGSGKSSIAHAILDLLPEGLQKKSGEIQFQPEEGRIKTLSDPDVNWKQLRGRQIGFLQQDIFGAFDPVMSIGRQLAAILKERTGRMEDELIAALRQKLMEMGLYEADRIWASFPHQLSGGQLQRCLLALVMVMNPRLLIADEPTSAIDKIRQQDLLKLLKALRDRYGIAILCITHEPDVVAYLADREIPLDAPLTRQVHTPTGRSRPHVDERKPVLEAIELEMKHKVGRIREKAGASIGPLRVQVFSGQCVGVVGESGSGKSSLAQMLVGWFTPTGGKIRYHDQVIDLTSRNDLRKLRTAVQLVMQDGRGALHPYRSIRSILGEIRDLGAKRNGAEALSLEAVLQAVGLTSSILELMPDQLSGGECLRVNIARALFVNPEVLICDESTAALDPPTRDSILDMLGQLVKDRGLGLVFITHDREIITKLADHLMVMSDGKVVEQGAAADILHYPTHPVTKKIFAPHTTFGEK